MNWTVALIVVGAVAAALNAGAFFAFSNFVMPALADMSPADGAAAMQSINRAAPNPLFVATILGAGLVGMPVLVSEWSDRTTPEFRWVAGAVVLAFLSTVVTVACNVPRNDLLGGLDVTAASSAPQWNDYVVAWTRWNTVRTVMSAGSVVAYALALRSR